MLLKSADDKTKRIRLLEELQRSDRLDSVQRDWLETELDRLRKGIAGEKSAAYYLNSYLADSQNSVLVLVDPKATISRPHGDQGGCLP